MTVPSETSSSAHVGNGVTTVFSTGFYFLAKSEVDVYLTPSGGTETLLTEGIDYTLSVPTPGSGAAGDVTMLVAPGVGDALSIQRNPDFEQNTNLRGAGTFSASAHENALDRLTFQTTALLRRVSALESAGAPGSVTAGDGLSFSGATLHVGAGDGIVVNADDVEVNYGVAASMVASDATAASGGTNPDAARIDHKHTITVGAAVAVTAGGANSAGSGAAMARANHTHAAAVAAPVDVDAAAAVTGASGNFSDANHKHRVSTGNPVAIGVANAAGVADSLARSDHVHNHGAQTDPAQHALAVAGVSHGFLSSTDATKLSNLGTIFAARSHVAAYQNAAQAMPTGVGGAVALFNVEEYDAANEFDPATGIFTATSDGYYLVTFTYALVAALWALPNVLTAIFMKNAVTVVSITAVHVDAAINRESAIALSAVVKLLAGENLRVYVQHNQGGAVNSAGTVANRITIDRVV